MDAEYYASLVRENLLNNRPRMARELKAAGTFEQHCSEKGRQAAESAKRMVAQMLEQMDPPKTPEQALQDQGYAKLTVDEIILSQLLLPDEATERAMRNGGYTD
jgi:hypothetical protein